MVRSLITTVRTKLSETRLPMAGGYYGRETFEPGRIIGQIAAIHAFFYFTFAILLLILDYVLGVSAVSSGHIGPLIVDQMLSYRALSLRSAGGLAAAIALVVSAVVSGSLAFISVVGRARRALDFSVTMMTVHLLCCSLYAGFPRTITWWGLNAGCTVVMTVVCETMSRKMELRDISVPARDRERDIEAQQPLSGGEESDVVRPA